MKLVGVLDLRQNLAKHLDRVAEEGEGIIIVQRSKPVARLIPYREEPMSEEQSPYVYGTRHDDDEQNVDLPTDLASTALARCNLNKSAARRALLQALMKLEDSQP